MPGTVDTLRQSTSVPEDRKKRAVLNAKKGKVISKRKACKILEDGSVRGKDLTRPQQKFFGARCHR